MRRLFICVIAVMSVIISSFCFPGTAFADGSDIIMSGSCGADLRYTITEDGLLTITGTGDMCDYTCTHGSVNPFQNGASSSASQKDAIVKKIVIEEGVTSIGKYAFAWCFNLESIEMPDSLKSISLYAFEYCRKIKNMHIPKGVTDISGSVFHASAFETITADPDNPDYYAVDNCLIERETGTLIAGTKNSVIPDDGSVVKIGYGAFYNRIGKSVYIPAAITALSTYALGSSDEISELSVCYGGTREQWDAMTKKELDPANHRQLKNVYIGHKYKRTAIAEADCLNAGENHCVCRNCGFETTETVPALGHDPVKLDAVAPTCVKSGLTEGSFCGRCDAILAAQEIVPALGHDMSKKNTGKTYLKSEATCTSPAVYYFSCTRCGEKGSATFEYGSSLGHSFTRKVKNKKYLKSAATCTEPETYYYACERCDEVGSATYAAGAPAGHKWNGGEKIKAATCEETGETVFTCTVCGETKTVTIPATGHDYVVFENKAPTCTEGGFVKSVCMNDDTHIRTEILDKIPHADADNNGYCDMCGLVIGQIRGDVDGFGLITAWDARFALRCSAGLEIIPADKLWIIDIDKDGRVTAFDARLILRASAHLENPVLW